MAGKKRRRDSNADAESQTQARNAFGMGQTLSILRGTPDTTFNSVANADPNADNSVEDKDQGGEWQVVKRQKKEQNNYPAIVHSAAARLKGHVKIGDLQALTLYLLADGPAPQWVSIRHHNSINHVAVLMVPGLEWDMFNGKIALPQTEDETQPGEEGSEKGGKMAQEEQVSEKQHKSPDDYYPVKLVPEKLPAPLKPLAGIFPHVWPIKTPGDSKYDKVHSPLHAMLTSPLPKSKEDKKSRGPKPPREGKDWEGVRTPITNYIATRAELEEDEYIIHPTMFDSDVEKESELERRRNDKQLPEHGWVDSSVQKLEDGDVPDKDIEKGSVLAGREVLAMDCEMCKTAGDVFELTRISLVRWDGSVVMDELVKPDNAIVDYLTPYSGMTEAMLAPITTTLADIQKRLLDILTPHTILIGHSLNSDLTALKMTHPFIIDTTMLYPHPRGPPLKSSLKWLSQKYLNREIQKNHGSTGHDSVEDARACLDLVKQKCERGPRWGTNDASSESIFKRLGRSNRPLRGKQSVASELYRTGAVVDWGEPARGHGSFADVAIGCKNDADVVQGMKNALNGFVDKKDVIHAPVDFAWGRLRELEAIRGWWNRSRTEDNAQMRAEAIGEKSGNGADADSKKASIGDVVANTVAHITSIYESLPKCTAFIVYSGTGDPRETFRLQALKKQFREEYKVKKWDQLSVKWTDTEDQALKRACSKARDSIGFVVVK